MSDFLMIGGARVPIAASGGADEEYQELGGEVVRSFSGRLLSTVRGRARVWRLQTPPLPESEAQELAAVLAHGSPLMCSGALIGSDPVSCYARGVRTRPVPPLSRLRRVVEFELHEAAPMASPILFRLHAGQPIPPGVSFTRASSAWYVDRTGTLREVGPHVPRIEWYDRDGDGVRETPALRLEPSRTNLLLDSCNLPASGSAWGSTSNFTVSPAASLFAGQTAWRHTNDGLAPSRNRSQSGGQFGSGPHTAYVIVENVDAAQTALNIRDTTAGANVCVGRLSWATGEASVQEGTGAVRAEKLADAGPNGGPVYLLAVTATGTPGNNRRIFLYPTGTSQNTDTVIIHHVQLEEQPVHTSPIVTADTPVTRAADSLTFPWPHAPQAMTGYLRFVERGAVVATSANVTLFRLGTVPQGRIMVERLSNDSRYVCRYFRNDSTAVASVLPTSPVPAIGDQVELLWRLYADGSVQIEQAINGGAPVVAARSAATGLPTEWSGQILRLSGVPSGGSVAPAAWRDAIVLRGAGWTMDAVRRIVG